MRYKALVATGHEDAFGYTFSEGDLDDLVEQARGKPVLLMFTQRVGYVMGAERTDEGVVLEFDSDKDASHFYCVPAFHEERLFSFGLVTAPADAALGRVREAE